MTKLELQAIGNWVFDLDDTIISTRKGFRSQMSLVYDYFFGLMPAVPKERIQGIFEDLNDEAYKTEKVNSNRWLTVVRGFSEEFPRIGITEQAVALAILDQIYQIPPEFLPGAEETLTQLKNQGKRQFIVTHSNEEYAWRKYDGLRLSRFVPRENVYIADENKDKGTAAWRDALDKFGLSPAEVAVVGNSAKDDIWPAFEIGVQNLFFVKDKIEWVVHVKEPPEIARRITSISELI